MPRLKKSVAVLIASALILTAPGLEPYRAFAQAGASKPSAKPVVVQAPMIPSAGTLTNWNLIQLHLQSLGIANPVPTPKNIPAGKVNVSLLQDLQKMVGLSEKTAARLKDSTDVQAKKESDEIFGLHPREFEGQMEAVVSSLKNISERRPNIPLARQLFRDVKVVWKDMTVPRFKTKREIARDMRGKVREMRKHHLVQTYGYPPYGRMERTSDLSPKMDPVLDKIETLIKSKEKDSRNRQEFIGKFFPALERYSDKLLKPVKEAEKASAMPPLFSRPLMSQLLKFFALMTAGIAAPEPSLTVGGGLLVAALTLKLSDSFGWISKKERKTVRQEARSLVEMGALLAASSLIFSHAHASAAVLAMAPFGMPGGEDRIDPARQKMLQDLGFLHNVLKAQYAPAPWKKKFSGWDLDEEIRKAREEVLSSPGMTIKQYQRIVKHLILSTRDYHVSVRFVSTESASLPFRVQGANGRYFIVWIDREKLPKDSFPFEIGDELVRFDGKSAAEAVREIQDGLGENSEKTERALASIFLTVRSASSGFKVPKGPVTISVVPKGSQKALSRQMAWTYVPESVDYSRNPLGAEAQDLRNQIPGPDKAGSEKPWINDMLSPLAFDPSLQGEENLFNLGTRKSFIPELGTKTWESEEDNPFHAYIYRSPSDGRLIGYVRIPSYSFGAGEAHQFAELMKKFESETEALVIDQVNNPGGSLFYLYALLSMLTEQPMSAPRHRVAITQREVADAASMLKLEPLVNNDEDARGVLGPDIGGYPVSYQFFRLMMDYARFILNEWKEGRTLTETTHLYGVDAVNPSSAVRYAKPVMILVNELDFSGGDFFPAILQDNKRATVFGTRTSGAGGFVRSLEYPNLFGIRGISLTGSIAERIDGNPIENLGISPDVEYALTEKDYQNGFTDYVRAINATMSKIIQEGGSGAGGSSAGPARAFLRMPGGSKDSGQNPPRMEERTVITRALETVFNQDPTKAGVPLKTKEISQFYRKAAESFKQSDLRNVKPIWLRSAVEAVLDAMVESVSALAESDEHEKLEYFSTAIVLTFQSMARTVFDGSSIKDIVEKTQSIAQEIQKTGLPPLNASREDEARLLTSLIINLYVLWQNEIQSHEKEPTVPQMAESLKKALEQFNSEVIPQIYPRQMRETAASIAADKARGIFNLAASSPNREDFTRKANAYTDKIEEILRRDSSLAEKTAAVKSLADQTEPGPRPQDPGQSGFVRLETLLTIATAALGPVLVLGLGRAVAARFDFDMAPVVGLFFSGMLSFMIGAAAYSDSHQIVRDGKQVGDQAMPGRKLEAVFARSVIASAVISIAAGLIYLIWSSLAAPAVAAAVLGGVSLAMAPLGMPGPSGRPERSFIEAVEDSLKEVLKGVAPAPPHMIYTPEQAAQALEESAGKFISEQAPEIEPGFRHGVVSILKDYVRGAKNLAAKSGKKPDFEGFRESYKDFKMGVKAILDRGLPMARTAELIRKLADGTEGKPPKDGRRGAADIGLVISLAAAALTSMAAVGLGFVISQMAGIHLIGGLLPAAIAASVSGRLLQSYTTEKHVFHPGLRVRKDKKTLHAVLVAVTATGILMTLGSLAYIFIAGHQVFHLASSAAAGTAAAISFPAWPLSLSDYTGVGPESYFNLGTNLYENGDLQNSVRAFRKALRLDKNGTHDPHLVRNNLGAALYQSGLKSRAESEFKKAIRLYRDSDPSRPEYVLARYNLGIAYSKEGKWDLAAAELSKAAFNKSKSDAEQADIYAALARALKAQGLHSAARSWQEKARRVAPEAMRLRPDFRLEPLDRAAPHVSRKTLNSLRFSGIS